MGTKTLLRFSNLLTMLTLLAVPIFSVIPIRAEDRAGGGHEGGGHGGEGHSGGDGHGEPAGAADPAHGVESSEPHKEKWSDVLGRVQGLQAKIRAKQEALQKLLSGGGGHGGSGHGGGGHGEGLNKNEAVQEAMREHRELQTLIREYEKERTYLQYRFPEKGQKAQVQYKRIEAKDLDSFEKEMSMQAKLDQSMKLLRKRYNIEEPTDKKQPSSLGSPLGDSHDRYEIFEPKVIGK